MNIASLKGLRTIGGAAAGIILCGVVFDRVALGADPAGWTDTMTCHFTGYNGIPFDVQCPSTTSCDCKDFQGYTCEDDGVCHIAMRCARICDEWGRVVSGSCKCACLFTNYDEVPEFEPNCTPED